MSSLDDPTQETVFQAMEELLAIGRFPNAMNIQEHLNCTGESVKIKISTHAKAWIRGLGPSYRNVTLASLRSGALSEDFGERVARTVHVFKGEFTARHGDHKRRETEVLERERQLEVKEAALDRLVARLGGWLCLEDRENILGEREAFLSEWETRLREASAALDEFELERLAAGRALGQAKLRLEALACRHEEATAKLRISTSELEERYRQDEEYRNAVRRAIDPLEPLSRAWLVAEMDRLFTWEQRLRARERELIEASNDLDELELERDSAIKREFRTRISLNGQERKVNEMRVEMTELSRKLVAAERLCETLQSQRTSKLFASWRDLIRELWAESGQQSS